MTKCDINVLYVEISKLLEDICGFLTGELQDGKLSAKEQHEANLLILRSKRQLVNIAKVSPDNDSGRYVDMRPPPSGMAQENDSSQNEIYAVIPESRFDEGNDSRPDFIDITCPFDNMSAQNIPKGSKQGWLERREKFLFIGHQRKVYASVLKQWMAIYHSDKDSKPLETINLYNFEAKIIECPKNNKHTFELVSRNDDYKNCTFNATTSKDALQWITAINDHLIRTENDNEYDGVINMKNDSKFIQVLPPRQPDATNIIFKKWDPQKRPVPTLPEEEKEPSDYDKTSRSNSFSDTDSDAPYDVVINMSKNNHKRNSNSFKGKMLTYNETPLQDDEDVEYDEVLTLPLPTQPPVIKEQNKPILSPNKPKLKPKPPLKLFK